MRFWDSSGIVALLVEEPATEAARRLFAEDGDAVVWGQTPLEVLAALWRRRRRGQLDEAGRAAAEAALRNLEGVWSVVLDLDPVEDRARRILAVHPIRAVEAAQLAAALVACEDRCDLLPFVTFDEGLGEAARREGFSVLPRG